MEEQQMGNNPQEIQPNLVQLNNSELNAILRNIPNFYYALCNAGLYLPDLESKTITFTYLINCLNQTIFTVNQSDITPAIALKKVNKIELFLELERIIQSKQLHPLGIKITSLPNKIWLLNILKYLEPRNHIFTGQEVIIQSQTVVNLEALRLLNFNLGPQFMSKVAKNTSVVKQQKLIKKFEKKLEKNARMKEAFQKEIEKKYLDEQKYQQRIQQLKNPQEQWTMD